MASSESQVLSDLSQPRLRYSVSARGSSRSTAAIAAWLCLIGVAIPAWEVAVRIGGVKFTVGRFGVALLLLPALQILFQNSRRFIFADALIATLAIWMVAAGAMAPDSFSSSAAEALELAGGYYVARAFFFGPSAVRTFVSVLETVTVVTVVLGLVDRIANRNVIHQFFASMFGVGSINYMDRDGVMRVASTLDHPILFGAFCAIVAAILLYGEPERRKHILTIGVCAIGVYLARSSSGIMAAALTIAIYGYDKILERLPGRWLIFWLIVGPLLLVFFLVANSPMGWIISHFTLDPSSGYFRMMIWEAVFAQLPKSPYFGFGFGSFNDYILDKTVDSVWLVIALRFGVPAVVLILLSNIAVLLPVKVRALDAGHRRILDMGKGFTLALLSFLFIGLTVHYWNFMWIFWGLCLGVRGSFREYALTLR